MISRKDKTRGLAWLLIGLLASPLAMSQTRLVDQSAPIRIELKALIGSREAATNVNICQAILRVHNDSEHDIALQLTATPQDILGYRIEPMTGLANNEAQIGTGALQFEQIPAGKDRQNALYLRGISCDIVYMQLAIDAVCQDLSTGQPCMSGIGYFSSVRDVVGAPRPIVANGYRYDPKNLDRQIVQLLMKHPELRKDLETAMQNNIPLYQSPESTITIDVENEVTDLTINGGADTAPPSGDAQPQIPDMPSPNVHDPQELPILPPLH